MSDRTSEKQLTLFSTQLTWQELPKEVCEKAIELIAALYVQTVIEASTPFQEKRHEQSRD
jgi:hypothetical protein